MPGLLGSFLILATLAAAYALFEAAERYNRRGDPLAASLCLLACAIAAVLVLGLDWRWLQDLGIDPTRHGYGAAVWTLLGYTGLHVGIGAVMALWCLARMALGMIDSWRSLTLRLCLLWWRFTSWTTALVVVIATGFPHVVS